uniref:Uncharacterized protein n=1 Tax=Bursaphelenchus xylophilus TaxID=6326 RepID=A0A1I7SFH7_BURXY
MDLTAIGALLWLKYEYGLGLNNFDDEELTPLKHPRRASADDEELESSFDLLVCIGVVVGVMICFINIFIIAMRWFCRYKKKQFGREVEQRAIREMEVMYGLMGKRKAARSTVEERVDAYQNASLSK